MIFNGGLFLLILHNRPLFQNILFFLANLVCFHLLLKHLKLLTDEAYPINTYNFWSHFPENTPNIYCKVDTANDLQNKKTLLTMRTSWK